MTYTKTAVLERGLEGWSSEIEGKLTSSSIPNISNVETVDIGTSVTSIGDSAFFNCSDLNSITIPDGIISIEGCAFWECHNL